MKLEVRRRDYPKMEHKNKRGEVIKTFPAHYVCRYLIDGREIAVYDSIRDVLYLNTPLISRDRTKSDYQRALSGDWSEAYRYLFATLNVDENSSLSEYFDL